jgi:F-type H+-transporting ATPase subunit alpha
VSRVGGNAQIKAVRQVAGSLRLDLAQYRELAAFAQFGSDQLDKATQAQLARGQRLTEILKQGQFSPLAVEEQVVEIFAGTSGLIDDVAVADIQRFEKGLLEFMHTRYGSLLVGIVQKKQITDEARTELKRAIGEYKEQFQAGAAVARA